jgi:hypothetical protein
LLLLAASLLFASDSSLYVKVQLDRSLKISSLKPGDIVHGKLANAVYSRDHEVFPAGLPVRLQVNQVARRRRQANDHWPWVVQVFTPRYEKYPVFHLAAVTLPSGPEVQLHASVVFLDREIEVRGHEKKSPSSPSQTNQDAKKAAKTSGPMLVLEATLESDNQDESASSAVARANLETGTPAKIVLLDELSAKKSRAGDAFQARVIEPVRRGSQVVLPEGSVLTGEVTGSTPPRWLSRSGSLHLRFTGLNLPDGNSRPVIASLSAAHLDRGSRTRMDAEGGLRGDRPGKAWMVLNLGATLGIGKIADDGTQLLIEALISTATDISTAGTARVISTCVSGVFLLSRHGRDVVLPRYTELEIVFDRPVDVPAPATDSGF